MQLIIYAFLRTGARFCWRGNTPVTQCFSVLRERVPLVSHLEWATEINKKIQTAQTVFVESETRFTSHRNSTATPSLSNNICTAASGHCCVCCCRHVDLVCPSYVAKKRQKPVWSKLCRVQAQVQLSISVRMANTRSISRQNFAKSEPSESFLKDCTTSVVWEEWRVLLRFSLFD